MDSYESNGKDDHEIAAVATADHGWQKVTYHKRQRKQKPAGGDHSSAAVRANGDGSNNVFRSIEERSEDRHRRILEEQRAAANAASAAAVRSKRRSEDDDDEEEDSDDSAGKEIAAKAEEEKKVKQKEPKKPKVTVAEAAATIDSSDLAAFLADISGLYEGKPLTELMRLADYFGTKFTAVSSAQFPWVKLFRESTISKIAHIPLSHISDAVYKTSTDWINQHSIEALSSFVIWCLENILSDLSSQHASSKGSKKGAQQPSSKSQVAMFVVLAMVLRRKPDALVNVLATLRESSKYQGQDKLPLVAWMVVQASHGDLAVGLYSWTNNLLPIISGKSPNPQSRDIILQLVERIISTPKARTILVNSAIRRGERLIPPSSFESLMRLTFPASSARVKATERFEAVYPTLKEVALAGSTGSKAMKQVSQQIFNFTVKAAGEGIPELSKEAAGIAIWCLAENADCYKQWDKAYLDNLNASVAILKKLSEEWKELSGKLAPFDPLREILKTFRQKNEQALSSGADAAQQVHFQDAEKYCKGLQRKLSRGHGCLKGMVFVIIGVAVSMALISPSSDLLDWKKLYVLVNSKFSH